MNERQKRQGTASAVPSSAAYVGALVPEVTISNSFRILFGRDIHSTDSNQTL
jgi:hypothetical protein